jgi:hypothetical protein
MKMSTRKIIEKLKVMILAIVMLSWPFQSCDHSYIAGIEDIQDYTYSPVVALPLVNSQLKIDDLIDLNEISLLEIDEENLITLVYRGNAFSVSAYDVFSIPDHARDVSFENLVPTGSGSTTFPPHETPFLLNFDNNEVIDSVGFLSGYISIAAQADALLQDGYSLEATFSIPNGFDADGNPLQGMVNLSNPGQIDLAGASIKFSNEANSFNIEYTITISGDGTPANSPYTVTFSQNLVDVQYDVVQGYIDQIDFQVGSSRIPVDIFSNINLGNIMFANPSIDFIINNSFGMPVDLYVAALQATLSDDEIKLIDGEVITNPWRINYPSRPQDDAATTTQLIDSTNTNLFDVISQSPKEFFYNLRGITNPDATVDRKYWIKHNSEIDIDAEVRLPLWGRINFFSVEDTLGITLDGIPEEIEWLEVKMNLSNGFPLGVELDLILLDDQDMVLDTLFKNNKWIAPAATNLTTSYVEVPVITSVLEMLDKNTIELFQQTSKIVYKARFETYDSENNTNVKILDTYGFGLELGIRAKGKTIIKPGESN